MHDLATMRFAYPVIRRAAASYQLHGQTIPEPYEYLEDPANPETVDFVNKQNDLFSSYMKSSQDLRDRIVKRVTEMLDYPRTDCPSLRNGKFYYHYNSGLQNQSVIMQAAALRDEAPKVFLDPNKMSADGTTALKSTGWSQNEEYFAYSLSDKGSDWQHIHVRDVAAEKDLTDDIQWVKFSGISWWKNEGFFYTRYPELADVVDKGAETDSARDAFICFHAIGSTQKDDIEVLKVPDHPFWSLAAEVSDCHRYLIVSLMDGCEPHNLVWIAKLPATLEELRQPLSFTKTVNEFEGEYQYLGNDDELFYFTSTKEAPRKKVVSIDVESGTLTEIVSEQTSVLKMAGLTRDVLLLVYLEDVKDVFYYRKLSSSTLSKLDLPVGTITSFFAKRDCDFISFKVSSFLLPGRSFTTDINDIEGSLAIFKDDTVSGFQADDYVTEQRFYTSPDGTKIPMFIVHKKGAVSATSPVLLYGYGGFNISLTPSFSPSRIVFLQNLGGILAIPNIRGGGEYGQEWHDAGRRGNKQNCFTDFVAAAKYLHANGFGSPATTAIMGGSNGGLLVGATTNQAPSEFACAVCQVGVLDMYKFHKFTIGHAWISDYGNPDKEEDFAVVEKYSPIHNVQAGVKYPAILVVTADHDDRVVPLHSLKYIATLQHANPNLGGPFLARVEVAAGHGAGKPTSKIVEETSDMYAFMAKNIGATWHE